MDEVPAVGDLVRVTRMMDAPAEGYKAPSVGVEALLYRIDADEPRYKLQHVGYAAEVEVVQRGGGDWLSRVVGGA